MADVFKSIDEAREAMSRLLVGKELLGLSELACVLDQSKSNTSNLMSRNKIPQPDEQLNMGSVWKKQTIKDFISNEELKFGILDIVKKGTYKLPL